MGKEGKIIMERLIGLNKSLTFMTSRQSWMTHLQSLCKYLFLIKRALMPLSKTWRLRWWWGWNSGDEDGDNGDGDSSINGRLMIVFQKID